MAPPTTLRLPLLLPLLHAAAASTNVLNAWSIHSLTRNCQSAAAPCLYTLTLSTAPLALSNTKATAADDDTYYNNANTYGEYPTYGTDNTASDNNNNNNNEQATAESASILTCTFTLPTSYLPFSALPCSTTTTTSAADGVDEDASGEYAAGGSGEYAAVGGSGEYTVSGAWDSTLQGLSLVVVGDGVGEEGRAEFGFKGEEGEGGVVQGVKMVAGEGVEMGMEKMMGKKKRGEGKLWKVKGLTRYPDTERNETDWQFSLLDNETGLEQACLLSSPGSDPSASFYGIPCDANPRYRISWGHNRDGDSAVMTVCYTANGTDAWFGFEKVSAMQLLGDSQLEPVYYTGCA